MSKATDLRILHVITGLNPGGAELMLCRLVGALERKGVANAVCTLTSVGEVGSRLRRDGIPVYSVDMRKHPLKAITGLREIISRSRPQVLHTWLYHADLLGGIAARKFPGVTVIWSLRNSRLKGKWTTRAVARLCGLLSGRLPKLIVACAESARCAHVARGYPADRIEVIPNGYDTARFFPDPERGGEVRRGMGIGDDAVVFGLVGRSDPHKDYEGFIGAAAKFAEANPDSRALFVFCGWQMDDGNAGITALVDRLGLRDRVVLAGARSDMEDLYQAFDVVVSSSISEGFPNVVGEAMACGKPCIVTDVGDSRRLLDGAGILVPPGDPGAMAGALARMASLTPEARAELGAAGRRNIEENYELAAIADRYLDLYSRGVAMCAA